MNWVKSFIFYFIVFFYCWPISRDTFSEVVIWDVGQGLMVSIHSSRSCQLIDAGGSYKQWPRGFLTKCQNKPITVYITHYDYDHIRYLREIKYYVSQKICLNETLPQKLKPRQQKVLNGFNICAHSPPNEIQTLFTPYESKRNSGRIYSFKNHWLFPGDSEAQDEMQWSTQLPNMSYFVVGHHGSKTSTSQELVAHLGSVKQAFVSALKKKYGHPHPVIVKRLREGKIPLVGTEEFGSLHVIDYNN